MSRFKTGLILGAAAGYVLGTRAGREQYERISRAARMAWNSEPAERLREELSTVMPPGVTNAAARFGDVRFRDAGVFPAARLPA